MVYSLAENAIRVALFCVSYSDIFQVLVAANDTKYPKYLHL